MSYGLEVRNSSGVIILDSDKLHARKVASGSAAATGAIPTNGITLSSITLPVTVANPIVYARSTIGSRFWVSCVPNSNALQYVSEGVLDYVVFDGSAPPASSGYGLELFNSAGTRVFSTDYPMPHIYQRAVSVTVAEATAASAPDGLNKSITFSMTARDGGLPFISEFGTELFKMMVGTAGIFSWAMLPKFTSATNLDLLAYRVYNVSLSGSGATHYPLGAFPHVVSFAK